ncbi:hypothetical protein A2U01_0113254, partial [Trifolium medium]|nr:hypothetical protein [Trifolium medium]
WRVAPSGPGVGWSASVDGAACCCAWRGARACSIYLYCSFAAARQTRGREKK